MGKFPLSVSSQWFNWVNSFIFLAMEQFYPVLCCCADDWVHWVSAFQIADLFYLQNTLQKANVSHQHHPAMACHYSLLFCYWSTSLKMDKWFSLMMPKRIFFFGLIIHLWHFLLPSSLGDCQAPKCLLLYARLNFDVQYDMLQDFQVQGMETGSFYDCDVCKREWEEIIWFQVTTWYLYMFTQIVKSIRQLWWKQISTHWKVYSNDQILAHVF